MFVVHKVSLDCALTTDCTVVKAYAEEPTMRRVRSVVEIYTYASMGASYLYVIYTCIVGELVDLRNVDYSDETDI